MSCSQGKVQVRSTGQLLDWQVTPLLGFELSKSDFRRGSQKVWDCKSWVCLPALSDLWSLADMWCVMLPIIMLWLKDFIVGPYQGIDFFHDIYKITIETTKHLIYFLKSTLQIISLIVVQSINRPNGYTVRHSLVHIKGFSLIKAQPINMNQWYWAKPSICKHLYMIKKY